MQEMSKYSWLRRVHILADFDWQCPRQGDTADFIITRKLFIAIKDYFIKRTRLTNMCLKETGQTYFSENGYQIIDAIYNDYFAVCHAYDKPHRLIVISSDAYDLDKELRFRIINLITLLRNDNGVKIRSYANNVLVFDAVEYKDYFNIIRYFMEAPLNEDIDIYSSFNQPLPISPDKFKPEYLMTTTNEISDIARKLYLSGTMAIEKACSHFGVTRNSPFSVLKDVRIKLSRAWINSVNFDIFLKNCKDVQLWEYLVSNVYSKRLRGAYMLHTVAPTSIYWYSDIVKYIVRLYEYDQRLCKFIINETKLIRQHDIASINLAIHKRYCHTVKQKKIPSDAMKYRRNEHQGYDWGYASVIFPEDPEMRWEIKNALRYDESKYDSYESRLNDFY